MVFGLFNSQPQRHPASTDSDDLENDLELDDLELGDEDEEEDDLSFDDEDDEEEKELDFDFLDSLLDEEED